MVDSKFELVYNMKYVGVCPALFNVVFFNLKWSFTNG